MQNSDLISLHDPNLAVTVVLLAASLGAALRVYGRAIVSNGSLKATWLMFAGVFGGVGVWAGSVAAILTGAHGLGFAFGFAPGLTLAALVLAVAGLTLGFTVGVVSRGAEGRLAGGLAMAVTAAGTHVMLLVALDGPVAAVWREGAVATALIVGVIGSVGGLFVAGRSEHPLRQVAGALALTAAVVWLQRLGLSAVAFTPDPGHAGRAALIAPEALKMLTATLSGLVLVGGVGVGVIYTRSNRSALDRLEAAIGTLPAGLAFYDADDRLLVWNQGYSDASGACRSLLRPGVRFRELLDADLASGCYPEAVGREAEWLETRLAARASAQGAQEQELDDGRWLRFEDRRTADGGTVSICVDITDLRRNADALAQARDQAEAANRAKSEFLANMSHEIRTPLNGVVAVADLLARAELGDRERDMVEMVRSSGATLERLLSDILDLARIESGHVAIEQEAFRLGEAVRSVTALAELKAQEKAVELRLDLAPEAEVAVRGDVVRVKQILTNLVSNAIKFTDRGAVTVSVAAAADGGWRLEVADTGVGFDATADKARLFGRFQQADGSITRRFGGTGLGLAISRQLAELMGGAIDCASRPGEGARFWVELPLETVHLEGAADAGPVETSGDAERAVRVLVADDHPTNRKVVELILAEAGVELTAVENGREALDAFTGGGFDVVLMDMQMPVMDGLTATAGIREHETREGLARTPVIMLTANALPEHVEAGRAAGADRHLTKPITASALIGAIASVLESATAEAAAAA